ncbi:tail fiber domain-containing protein [Escherichia coli]|uniref:pyocin knob domain-containing S74 family peptidase n=1 Tax=Escherichia coli TaxID=562 RepID=UPI0024ACB373|nr:pyocin knob domain-containing S74 family peptidase [Escherichia coli]MDI4364578.1 tail fiber domain-containing protein [Escherichia coli]MDI4393828.1 tail fiber domain-containing protein [Escherichia coli]MDI4476103.1 tail fiber domain-containing protein [Escherichia coli]
MIYTTGTIAISGNTVTGAGTNFSAPLSLIRVGCTLIAVGNPVQIFTITEIKSGTELSVTPAANPAIPAGTKFSILLSDSISVDGLAQDVAETLRYYQGKETEIAAAVEWWEDFGGEGQLDQLLTNIRAETAKSTANAQKTESDKNAAEASKTAAAKSATAAKTSETNAKASETAAKTSETNAKTSENRAQEYLNQIIRSNDALVQCNWPVTTESFFRYVKIAKITDPGAVSSHMTLMVTNGGNYGRTHGNIDFIEISGRGYNSAGEITSANATKFLSVRRLGSPELDADNQMRYGLVAGDGYFDVWCYQREYIKETKVAILSQTGRTELYIPEGYVVQETAPDGYIESPAIRIYDQENKPTKADLGLSNAMLIGAFGLGGSGIPSNGKMSDVELLKALRDKGGHFWRADKPTGSTATIYSHGSGIFSRCGDTWSAVNIDFSTAKIKIFAGSDNGLNSGNFAINELYGTQNKPSKSDVGLGNVTNDAQVRKTGDAMTGDLLITKATPSLYLRSKSGTANVWFQNEDQSERGVIWAPANTASLGEIRIRAKTTDGTATGDFVVRHDGRIQANTAKILYKVTSRTAEFANDNTNTMENTLKISGQQHTPLLLTRTGYSENLSIGFKVDDVDQKYLGIAGDGDLYFGSYSDHTKNSKVITQAILDSGVTVGGKTTFSDLATFNAGIAGSIEPETIDNLTIDLNDLTIKFTDKGSVKYYQCRTSGGGANITNRPVGANGNFLLRVESIRKVSDSDYINMQTLISGDKGRVLVRFNTNGKWTAWSEVVVSGWNQDVTVKSLTTNADIILKNSDDGQRLILRNSDTSAQSWSIRVWGQSGRESVFEIGNSNQYMFYAQEDAAGNKKFDFNGDISCKTLYQTSDQSLKDNIKVIGDATESIRKMNGYTYTFKDDGLPYAGVIAQEVMDALPEAIAFTTLYGKELQGPTTDGNVLREEVKCLSVDYAAVTGLLVQVARETDNRVTELEEENASLKANIAAMDERMAKLEALISQLTGSEE